MTNEEAIAILDTIPTIGEQVDALEMAIDALEENAALRRLIDWAVECDFGYDNIPEEYEKYKDEIEEKGLGYTPGLIYIAKQEEAAAAAKRKDREEQDMSGWQDFNNACWRILKDMEDGDEH